MDSFMRIAAIGLVADMSWVFAARINRTVGTGPKSLFAAYYAGCKVVGAFVRAIVRAAAFVAIQYRHLIDFLRWGGFFTFFT
jgi:hypothetical protein